MGDLESVEDVLKRLEDVVGKERMAYLDLSEEPVERICAVLGELADSDRGGLLILLGDENLVDEDGNSPASRLASLFPIVGIWTAQVSEGMLWVGLVAGHNGLRERCSAAELHRVAELVAIEDADLSELDVGPIGFKQSLKALDADDVFNEARTTRTPSRAWASPPSETVGSSQRAPEWSSLAAGPTRHLRRECIELNLYGQNLCWCGSMRKLEASLSTITIPCLLPGKKKFRELVMNALVHRLASQRVEASDPGDRIRRPARDHTPWSPGGVAGRQVHPGESEAVRAGVRAEGDQRKENRAADGRVLLDQAGTPTGRAGDAGRGNPARGLMAVPAGSAAEAGGISSPQQFGTRTCLGSGSLRCFRRWNAPAGNRAHDAASGVGDHA